MIDTWVTTAVGLDLLPVGSIVIDNSFVDSPVIACKALRGDWQLLGGDPERRWWSYEMIAGCARQPLLVLYRPDSAPIAPKHD